jgi:hypothetical protein
MHKLISELQRLYFIHDQQWHSQRLDGSGEPVLLAEGRLTPDIVAQCLAGEMAVTLDLVSLDGRARVMLVNFSSAADWEQAAKLYQAVQDDLDLPAPAVSVSGRKGYRLWFSITEPLPVAEVRRFLDALRRKYLADIPVKNLSYRPDIGPVALDVINLAPAQHMANGKWSAFIDPSMVGMFVDGPWLEMAPNMDRQADILAGLKSIKAGDFQRALSILETPAEPDNGSAPSAIEEFDEYQGEPALGPSGRAPRRLSVGSDYADPKSFLLAVMNDPSASARQRIKAARVLLPYFAGITSR